jgi:hypothetical protein
MVTIVALAAPLPGYAAALLVGEGEDQFLGDILAAAMAISPWIPNITTHLNSTAAITADLDATIVRNVRRSGCSFGRKRLPL